MIPDLMLVQKRWVNRVGKIPVQPNGRPASSTDPATWSSFDDVQHADFGFVLGDGWIGYDSDVGIVEEHLQLLDTYSEISPSGKGVHAIGRYIGAPLPGRKANGFEIYATDRYFTVTGNHVPWTPSTCNIRDAQFAELHARLFHSTIASAIVERPSYVPEGRDGLEHLFPPERKVLYEQARARAITRDLWNGIDAKFISQNGRVFRSHSEADLAWCAELAIITNADRELINRLFHESKMMRPKWDSKRGTSSVAERTIEMAIATTDDWQLKALGPRISRFIPKKRILW